LKSKIDRYNGNFTGGLEITKKLTSRVDRQFRNLGCGLFANCGEVLCELGILTDAEKVLRDQLKHILAYGWDIREKGGFLNAHLLMYYYAGDAMGG
jgi:hypothetical protein